MIPYLEPPPGSVISWRRQFSPGGPGYQYAAVHIANKGWYVTDRFDRNYTWPEILRLIGNSPCWVATQWVPLVPAYNVTGVTA